MVTVEGTRVFDVDPAPAAFTQASLPRGIERDPGVPLTAWIRIRQSKWCLLGAELDPSLRKTLHVITWGTVFRERCRAVVLGYSRFALKLLARP